MTYAPWYISAQAVRDWQRIVGYPQQDEGGWFDRAEEDLFELSRQATFRRKSRDGHSEYRAKAQVRGRSARLDLIVSTEGRPEGPLPQLIKVRAAGRNRH